MKFLSARTAMLSLLLVFTAMPAHAVVIGEHVASPDTYVITYTPRPNVSGNSQGFYVERHYDFAAKKLTERYFGESSMHIQHMKFSDFDDGDGGNYIYDAIAPKACSAGREESETSEDATAFVENFCGE